MPSRCKGFHLYPDKGVPQGNGREEVTCLRCDHSKSRPVSSGERKGLGRKPSKTNRNSLKRGRGFAASKAQREKVAGLPCIVCAQEPCDPAHLIPRGMGGCASELCVVPLCRVHHDALDRGHDLDLLPFLEPRWRDEVAHAVQHVGLENARVRLAPLSYERKAA